MLGQLGDSDPNSLLPGVRVHAQGELGSLSPISQVVSSAGSYQMPYLSPCQINSVKR